MKFKHFKRIFSTNYSKRIPYLFTFLILLSYQSASAGSLDGLPIFDGIDLTQVEKSHPNEPRVDIKYLGVGGYLIKWGNDQIMMAPSYSNPDPISLLANTRPYTKIIDHMIPDVSNVEMILVGHSHYDHVLDVPYIMNKYATKATVYGSATMKHLIASEVDSSRIYIMNNDSGTVNQAGNWVYNKSRKIRIMAIRSDHAPNATLFKGVIKAADGSIIKSIDWLFKVSPGSLSQDLDRMPISAFFWKEGQSFAYVVDFLNDKGQVAFRFHYEDSASTPERGFIPQSVLSEKAVDLAILTVANFNEIKMPAEVKAGDYNLPENQVKLYPQGIINNLNASHYILGHWENFFGNNYITPKFCFFGFCFGGKPILPLAVVPLTDANEFITRLTSTDPNADYVMPKPGAQMTFLINK